MYTKRDRAALDALVAATPTDEVELARSCTTGVTDLAELFGEALGGSKVSDPATFNPDLSSWDVSSVTNMNSMFRVRVPPSRVLLLEHRHVAVATRPPSPRSDITAHATRPPVPRCAVVCLCLQSAHRRLGRELGDEHVCHVCCTCSSIPRVAAALASPCRRRPFPIPSLRDRRSLHTAARPSLRCRMPLTSIRTSHRGPSPLQWLAAPALPPVPPPGWLRIPQAG